MFGIVVVERLLDYSCSPPLLVDSKCNIISRSLSHSVFDAVPDCSCAFPPDLKVIITDADVDMTNAVAEHLPNTVHLTLSLAHEYDGRTAKAHLGSAIAEHLPNTVQLSLSLAPDECDGRNAKAHLG